MTTHYIHLAIELVLAFLLMLNQKTLHSLLILTIKHFCVVIYIHIIIAMHTYVHIFLLLHMHVLCISYFIIIIIVCTECLQQLYGFTMIL